MERTNSGVYHEMKERMAIESDPFTLFDIALNQTIARDVRQTAANRLTQLHWREVNGYIKSIADPELLGKIARSHLFASTVTFLAKSIAKNLTQDSVIDRLLAAAQEQNALLKRLAVMP